MASDAQLAPISMLGRDRQRGTTTTDVESSGNQNTLMNSNETQAPRGLVVLSHSPSDVTGNLGAPQILSPEGLWFDNQKVSRQVTRSIKSYYRAPYTCWRDTPDHVKSFWWTVFRDRYQWAPEHASLVKEKFHQKGQNRLKDLVCKVTKKKPEDPIPWLSPDVREQLVQHKKTSRGFLKRSRQSMLNKTTGPKARSRHILGSVSAAKIAKRLRKAGETPTAAKLFAKAHVRTKGRTFPDDRSKVVWEKYQSLKLAKQVPTSLEDDGLFLEVAGGWTEKGTIYGLGNAAELFYNRPTPVSCSGRPSYTPSIVSQLQTELDSTKAELNSTKNELLQQRESVENQQQLMEEQRNQLEKQQKMTEEQREMLLAMQAQLKLMSQRQEPSI